MVAIPYDNNPSEVPYGRVDRTVAPTITPVSVADCKKHLNLDGTDDDSYIEGLINAATDNAESYTGRQLITATYTLKFNGFPDIIFLPKPPIASVTSITYVDTAGSSQTVTASDYQTDLPTGQYARPGRIAPAYGVYWPATRSQFNSVTVTYVAGYGSTASTVPQGIRQAITVAVATMYEHRESVATMGTKVELPEVFRRLLYPYRVISL